MTTPLVKTHLRRLLTLLVIALSLVAGASQDPPALLDLESCTPGSVGFYWALGSVRFEIVGSEDDLCRFEYFWEVEAGYHLYDCLAPAGLGRFELDPSSYRMPYGEEPWEVDTVIAPHCQLVRTGNLLLEQQNAAEEE